MTAETTTGLLREGVSNLLANGSFNFQTTPAMHALKTGECVLKSIHDVPAVAASFEGRLKTYLTRCLLSKTSSQRVRREKMWSSYRTSECYLTEWRTFLQRCAMSEASPMFCQYVGHYVFKQMIKLHYTIECSASTATGVAHLTYEETNALRYAAGYVPRALKKKLSKSAHPIKKDLQLCLLDLLDDDDEENNESKDWIELINCGGLTRINDITFQLFLAMEHELRKHLSTEKAPTLNDHVKHTLIENDDVQFLWSMISADWEEASASVLLQMVVNQWVKIRGFSYASAWVEHSTKQLIRKQHKSRRAFENSYFPDQKRQEQKVLKKPQTFNHITCQHV